MFMILIRVTNVLMALHMSILLILLKDFSKCIHFKQNEVSQFVFCDTDDNAKTKFLEPEF
jgi:hypothetical protein